MHITPDNRLKKLIVIGDRLFIKLNKSEERTVGVISAAGRAGKRKSTTGLCD